MAEDKQVKVFPGAVYECLRCGTKTPGDQLLKQPELTCPNCGYRLFKKARGTTPKTLKAE